MSRAAFALEVDCELVLVADALDFHLDQGVLIVAATWQLKRVYDFKCQLPIGRPDNKVVLQLLQACRQRQEKLIGREGREKRGGASRCLPLGPRIGDVLFRMQDDDITLPTLRSTVSGRSCT